MQRIFLTASLLLALSGAASASSVYKWVDAQGMTHFGAQPPEGQKATEINTAAPEPATPPAPNESAINKPDPQQREIDDKVKEQVAAQESERAEYCEKTKTNLAQLKNNPRLQVEKEDGKMARLSEKERQQKITDTQKQITDNCK